MKKFVRLFTFVLVFGISIVSLVQAQGNMNKTDKSDEWFLENDSPTKLLERVHYEANDDAGTKVQVTPLNKVSGKANGSYCDIAITDSRFTLTKTFCSIKHHIKGYLQYIVYIGLTAATIFIIRNGFKIVTATDKEAQMKKFKTNMINLIIGVVLLTSFYFILDVFVSVVNFIAGDS